MSRADLLFIVWWYGVGIVLAVATAVSMRSHERFEYEQVLKTLLIGIAAALVLYLVPSGLASISDLGEFKLRFFAALGVAWLAAMRYSLMKRTEMGFSALALAAFIGVNVPPLAMVVSVTMICGGTPTCL